MKKVQPNLTLGHITFLLLAFFISSGLFFYLGAKLGPGIIVSDRATEGDQALLPNEAVADEARKILAQTGHTYVFHDVLQRKTSSEANLPKVDSPVKVTSFFNKEVLINSDKDANQKTGKFSPEAPITKNATKPNLSLGVSSSTSEITLAKKIEAPLKDQAPVTIKEKPTAKPILLTDRPPEPFLQEPAGEPPIIDKPKTSAAYRLQIGSYSDKAKAEKALQEWRSRGFSAQVISTEVPGKGIWYRLNLGSYDDASAAQKAQSEISAKFRQTPMVVSNR
jgi:cell division protein FtsN